MPRPLSVAMICKNNAGTIGRTLASVAGLADQIIAVDSGSTDGTLDLLAEAGASVVRSPWLGYVKTKQLALERCTQPWVLSLDSDESLDAAARAAVERRLDELADAQLADAQGVAGVEFRRVVYYRDRPLRFAWQPEWRLRLVRRQAFRWAGMDPHDYLQPITLEPTALEAITSEPIAPEPTASDPLAPAVSATGVIGAAGPMSVVRGAQRPESRRQPRILREVSGHIRHDSIDTFAGFLAKQSGHAQQMAQSLHAAGRRGSLAQLLICPPWAFAKQLVVKQAWRDGWPGWLAAASSAAGALLKHAMLIEQTRTSSSARPSPVRSSQVQSADHRPAP